jgi:hypothetical protein
MTTVTDVCNRMLQKLGTRTTVTDAEIANNTSNEAIQFNLMYTELRDQLLRMAPWDCAMKTANLTYITSQPGTPENTSPATNLWQPGQPAPPWAYEYQYPVDCLAARWIIPSTQTGYAGGVPITTAVTGGASSWWWGQPVRFKVQTDAFYPVTAAAVAVGGSGHAVGDVITLPSGPTTSPPIGAPAQLRVTSVGVGGAITGVDVINVVAGSANPLGGSYFSPQANPVAQGSSTGAGTGASFNLTFGPQTDQRVILTNQEDATLAYTKQVIDPNVFDPAFRNALYASGGAGLCMALQGNRELANDLLTKANDIIRIARADDGNEGLTINDVTPDWIRIRGAAYVDGMGVNSGPYQGYDWGSYFPMY